MVNPFTAEAGANLRTARLQAGLTQAQAGARMMPRCTVATLSLVENGKQEPKVSFWLDAARVYNVAPGALLPIPLYDTLAVPALVLQRGSDPVLAPLVPWARTYGTEAIRITPMVLDHAAEMCGVDTDTLHALLTPLSISSHRRALWLGTGLVIPEPADR